MDQTSGLKLSVLILLTLTGDFLVKFQNDRSNKNAEFQKESQYLKMIILEMSIMIGTTNAIAPF